MVIWGSAINGRLLLIDGGPASYRIMKVSIKLMCLYCLYQHNIIIIITYYYGKGHQSRKLVTTKYSLLIGELLDHKVLPT